MLWKTRIARVVCSALVMFATAAVGTAAAQGQAPGGFLASATDNGMRATLSAGQVQGFLPQRGRFTFPSPYGTTGIRLTNGSDCGGQDCVNYVGYSYWRNINNHSGSDTMLIFVGLDRSRGGNGPTLFSYNKNSGDTRNLGPLFDGGSPYSWSNGEGWYFSGTRPNALYITDNSSRLMRYDVSSHALETVFDVRDHLGSDKHMKQMHSSNDDRVHSATVQDSGWAPLGCVAYLEDQGRAVFVPKRGDFDECQVDKSGRWLLIKETIAGPGEDNRIIDLQTGAERVFYDRDGAGGHSDLGYGYLVAEDDKYTHSTGSTVRVFRLDQDQGAAGQGTLVYNMSSWNSAGIGHIAHGNAAPGSAGGQMACSSNAERSNVPRVNEIVCYRLDGSLNVLVVAPNMTDLNASGGGGDDYSKRPKGNLDPTGEYFIWTSNAGTNRADAFIVRVPQQSLGASAGAPTPTPAPTPAPAPNPPSSPDPSPAPTPDPAPAPAPTPTPNPNPGSTATGWMSLINVTASGSTLRKSGGCQGCPDASAVSDRQIASGTGSLEFTVPDSGGLRFVGLAASGIGTAPGDIAFALRLQSGVAEVRESGAYRAETSFVPGDRFRIAVQGGRVTYAKNGAVFYTSGNQLRTAARAHVVFFDMNTAVSDVAVTDGSSGTASSSPAAAPAPTTETGGARVAVPRPEGSVPRRR